MAIVVLSTKKQTSTEEIAARLEIIRIKSALRATGGIQSQAARLVRLTPPTLNRKILRYGIDARQFQQSR